MRRTLLYRSPPHRSPPPKPPFPPSPFPPPFDNPYVKLTRLLINISCLSANYDKSFNQFYSMIASNYTQKITYFSPDEYITNIQRPLSDIENLYTCIKNSNLSVFLSRLNTTIYSNSQYYDRLFQSSKLYDKRFITFTINNTYILNSSVITLYSSGERIAMGIAILFGTVGMCICACICLLICSCIKNNKVYIDNKN